MWKSPTRMFPLLLFFFFSVFSYGYVYYFYDKRIFETVTYGKDWITLYRTQKDDPEVNKKFRFEPEAFKSNLSKLVLMWYPPFATATSPTNPAPDCYLTYDRSAIKRADAVIFHCAELPDAVHQLPERRKNQRWIWWCMEPPWNTRFVFRKSLTQFDGVFNLTMTYRLDSDILSSYGDISTAYNKVVDGDWSIEELLEGKTASSLGAWVVSNCAASKRRRIIDELSKYISIEIFGKCTGRPLCRPPCMQETLSRYKFYFSFENSECKDYITEKFWRNAIGSRTLPVVLGGRSRADYEKVVPPKSFIHVNDFSTVEELGRHLRKLATDDALYSEYFEWMSREGREKWKEQINKHAHPPNKGLDSYLRYNRSSGLAGVCNKLLHEHDTHDVVEQLDQWWYGPGYTEDTTKFSVCHVDSGPSGRPLGWLVTLVYTCLYFVIIVVVWWQCWTNRS